MQRQDSFKYAATALPQHPRSALAGGIGLALAAGSLQAATITVDTLSDGFLDGQCTLRSAIAAANANAAVDGCASGSAIDIDRIEFAAGLTGTLSTVAGVPVQNFWDGSQLRITESVTIAGRENGVDVNDVTINGTGAAPVIYITAAADQVTLENLTITGGYSPEDLPGRLGYGGGVLSYGRQLTLDGTVINNNRSVRGGGGLWHQPGVDNGVLIARDCLFALNRTTVDGLGEGGALAVEDSVVTINNCIFSTNESEREGGAVRVEDSALTGIVDSYFLGNTSTGDKGGALAISTTQPNVYLAGNTFDNNAAAVLGGAVSIVQRYVVDPAPADVQLIDNLIENSESGGNGGGFFLSVSAGELLIEDTRLVDNVAQGSGGGGRLELIGTQLTWRRSSLSGNSASGYAGGGGLEVRASEAQLDFERFSAFNNRADNGCGGGMTITSLQGNSGPDSIVFDDSIWFNNVGDCGGAIDVFLPLSESVQVLLDSNELTSNDALGLRLNGHGGAVAFSAGDNSLLVVSNSTLSGNTAALEGGGIYASNSASVSVKYSTFFDNRANAGRDIFSDGVDCVVRNSVLASTRPSALQGGSPCDLNFSLIENTADAVFTFDASTLRDVDPRLSPLANNGLIGWSLTHAPDAGSPAIDAGSASISAPPFDQRGAGFARVVGPAIDMGALETGAGLNDRIFSDRFDEGN
jgi:hypothetical protein